MASWTAGEWTGFIVAIVSAVIAIWAHLRMPGLERFRVRIEGERDVELEKFKADLRAQAFQRETVAQHLVSQQAAALAGIYDRIIEAEAAYQFLTSVFEHGSWPSKADRLRTFGERYNELASFAEKHTIYLPEATAAKVTQVLAPLKEKGTQFSISVVDDSWKDPEASKVWQECWKAGIDQIPALRKELATEFRRLLGVHQ